MDIGLQIQQQLKDENIFTPLVGIQKGILSSNLITKKRYIGIKYEFD